MAARNANLRALLSEDDTTHQTMMEMVTVMEFIEKEDVRGFRLATLLDPSQSWNIVESSAKPFHLDVQQYGLLCNLIGHTQPAHARPLSSQVLSVDKISIHGVCYGTSVSPKFRNSSIVFRTSDPQPANIRTQKAGSIQAIFQHTHQSPDMVQIKALYLVVREYLPLNTSNGRVDPYRKFGFAGGFLCKRQGTILHVIEQSQVILHVALTKMRYYDEDLIHVLPIDRVRD